MKEVASETMLVPAWSGSVADLARIADLIEDITREGVQALIDDARIKARENYGWTSEQRQCEYISEEVERTNNRYRLRIRCTYVSPTVIVEVSKAELAEIDTKNLTAIGIWIGLEGDPVQVRVFFSRERIKATIVTDGRGQLIAQLARLRDELARAKPWWSLLWSTWLVPVFAIVFGGTVWSYLYIRSFQGLHNSDGYWLLLALSLIWGFIGPTSMQGIRNRYLPCWELHDYGTPGETARNLKKVGGSIFLLLAVIGALPVLF